MDTSKELHVTLGGTGGIGRAVMRELLVRGKRVRVVSRTLAHPLPAGGEYLAGDISDPEQARRVCEGASVVYLCANPPYHQWAELFPPLVAGAITGASSQQAKLVFADNLYTYAPTSHPMTEELPTAPVTRKGKVRAQLVETLLAAHANGTARVVIGRASDYYGPEAPNSIIGDRFFHALLTGAPVEWLGKLDLPHTLSFVDDIARGLIILGEQDQALGQVWHIPAAEPLNGRAFIQLAAEVAGVSARAREVPAWMLRALGLVNPVMREVAEMLYALKQPYIMDGSKFQRAFPFTPTPHRLALETTIAAYRYADQLALAK
jgi:nucleoside-diphosphate-sugar epimerase